MFTLFLFSSSIRSIHDAKPPKREYVAYFERQTGRARIPPELSPLEYVFLIYQAVLNGATEVTRLAKSLQIKDQQSLKKFLKEFSRFDLVLEQCTHFTAAVTREVLTPRPAALTLTTRADSIDLDELQPRSENTELDRLLDEILGGMKREQGLMNKAHALLSCAVSLSNLQVQLETNELKKDVDEQKKAKISAVSTLLQAEIAKLQQVCLS